MQHQFLYSTSGYNFRKDVTFCLSTKFHVHHYTAVQHICFELIKTLRLKSSCILHITVVSQYIGIKDPLQQKGDKYMQQHFSTFFKTTTLLKVYKVLYDNVLKGLSLQRLTSRKVIQYQILIVKTHAFKIYQYFIKFSAH